MADYFDRAAVLAQVDDESELAKKTQNPVADLIRVPLQNNFNFGAVTIAYWTKGKWLLTAKSTIFIR
jgi:hypothetical protein